MSKSPDRLTKYTLSCVSKQNKHEKWLRTGQTQLISTFRVCTVGLNAQTSTLLLRSSGAEKNVGNVCEGEKPKGDGRGLLSASTPNHFHAQKLLQVSEPQK